MPKYLVNPGVSWASRKVSPFNPRTALDFNVFLSGRRVNHGAGTSLNNILATTGGITLFAVIRRMSDGANQEIITKDLTVNVNRAWGFLIDDGVGAGALRFVVDRASDADYYSAAGVIAIGPWYFVAATYDDAATPKGHLYAGKLAGGALTEPSYGTTTAGSGAFTSDTGASVWAGNIERAPTNAFRGHIARVGIVPRALSLPELQAVKAAPIYTPYIPGGTVLLSDYTDNNTCLDLSGNGNHGIVTSATAVETGLYSTPTRVFFDVGGIAFYAAANSGYQAASSSYTFNRTVAGSNTFLAVDVALLSAGQTVTSVIDDSAGGAIPMSLIGARSTVTAFGRIESWGLVAPVAGTKSIAVTLSGVSISSAAAVSYTGVHQTMPTEAYNSAQATNVGAADAEVIVTPIANNTWIHAAVATDDGSITAEQTTRNNVSGAGGSGANEDTGPISPATATTMSYTDVAGLATWAIGGYAIRPIAASGLITAAIKIFNRAMRFYTRGR